MTAEQQFNGIGCASVADVEIPEASSAYFKLDEWVHKIRVLQGPVLGYVSQEWEDGKPIGDKVLYKYDDPEAKKDKNARLQMTFLIYDYKTESVVVWEIAQKTILEQIKNINGIQPDLSAFDLQITRSAKWGRTSYSIAQWVNAPFKIQEAIDNVVSKNIIERLAELKSPESTLEAEEAEIQAEIAAKKAKKAPASTPKATPKTETEEVTVEDVEEQFK